MILKKTWTWATLDWWRRKEDSRGARFGRLKKEPQKVMPPTFQVMWASLPSTSGGPWWGPHMYGMGPTMYLAIARFSLPLSQAIALPSKSNKEVTIMDKVDFNTTKISSRQKGDSQ